MAESNKKGTQGTTSGSGSSANRSRTSGATDPSAGSVGGSSTTAGGGIGASGSSAGSSGLGTSGAATGSTGLGTSGAGSGASSSTRTSGTHEMSSKTSHGNGESSAHGLIGQMKSSASDTFQTVKSNTVAKLDEQKSTLSTGLMHVADNIRQLGSNLQTGQQADPLTRIAADYSETAAEKLRTAADYFNTHDVNTMYRDVEGLARRNPAVFLGGAFALGFIAARFLKSSSADTNRGISGRSMNTGSIGSSTRTPQLNSPRTSGTI